jgi:hypothetical protein
MAIAKGLTAAAAALALSISAAAACDDYDDEMAVAEALNAVKVAQSATPQQAPGVETASPASNQAESTSVAAADANPITESPTGTVRQ